MADKRVLHVLMCKIKKAGESDHFDYVTNPKSAFFNSSTQADFIH